MTVWASLWSAGGNWRCQGRCDRCPEGCRYFDEIFKLYYALKAPYRKKAQFLCNEALVLQLMTIKDNNGNYIWKPGLEIGKPDTLLNRPLKTSAFMPEIKGGSKVMAFGDYSYYWVADRQNRTFAV